MAKLCCMARPFRIEPSVPIADTLHLSAKFALDSPVNPKSRQCLFCIQLAVEVSMSGFTNVFSFVGLKSTKPAFAQARSALLARDIAAWTARRLTTATLRDLAAPFGLTHPDRVTNLARRAERAMEQSPRLRRQVKSLQKSLLGANLRN